MNNVRTTKASPPETSVENRGLNHPLEAALDPQPVLAIFGGQGHAV